MNYGSCINCIAEMKSDDTLCSDLIHWASYFITDEVDQSFATDQPMLCLPNFLACHVYGKSFYEGLFHNVSWEWLEADSSIVSQISFLGGKYVFVLFQSLRTSLVLHDLPKVKQRDFAVLLVNFLSTLRPIPSGPINFHVFKSCSSLTSSPFVLLLLLGTETWGPSFTLEHQSTESI